MGNVQLSLSGKVFSGMGKGRYYVGHPEYQKRFEKRLGYAPYPGTLNLKLEDHGLVEEMNRLRETEGTRVEGFTSRGESFSSLNCFDGRMDGERVTLLFIDVTYYNESVVELISPTYLRKRFGLKDGDRVDFVIDVPGSPKKH
jgi:riboflavin kinase, archaea type